MLYLYLYLYLYGLHAQPALCAKSQPERLRP